MLAVIIGFTELAMVKSTAEDRIYADLASWFSKPQIVELNLFCALMLAGGRMTYVQQAYEENLA